MHFNKKHLAWLVASEWDAQINQKKGIQPATMPFMTLTSTAIDQILPDSTFTIKTIMSYLRTDTMLFFTNEEDRILLEKQNEHSPKRHSPNLKNMFQAIEQIETMTSRMPPDTSIFMIVQLAFYFENIALGPTLAHLAPT